MKKILVSIVMMFLLTSCATITKFPVSNVVPTADITAKIKKDKQNNFEIKKQLTQQKVLLINIKKLSIKY